MHTDVAIIGGSFAGLSAALQLARARRSVTVLDTGEPRNRFAKGSHGFLTQDGARPADILAEARRQLAAYPTARFVEARAERRWKEMQGRGVDTTLEAIVEQLHRRDTRDTGRKDAPLAIAPDACVLDTSHLDRDEAVAAAIGAVEEVLHGK